MCGVRGEWSDLRWHVGKGSGFWRGSWWHSTVGNKGRECKGETLLNLVEVYWNTTPMRYLTWRVNNLFLKHPYFSKSGSFVLNMTFQSWELFFRFFCHQEKNMSHIVSALCILQSLPYRWAITYLSEVIRISFKMICVLKYYHRKNPFFEF